MSREDEEKDGLETSGNGIGNVSGGSALEQDGGYADRGDDAGTGVKADTGADTETNSDTGTDTDAGTDAYADADTGTDPDTYAGEDGEDEVISGKFVQALGHVPGVVPGLCLVRNPGEGCAAYRGRSEAGAAQDSACDEGGG